MLQFLNIQYNFITFELKRNYLHNKKDQKQVASCVASGFVCSYDLYSTIGHTSEDYHFQNAHDQAQF